MKKCPICNGCLEHTWIKNLHFLFCFLCQKYYIIKNNKLIEVEPTSELKKFERSIN